MTGLFFVSYILGDPAAIGPMLQLNLSVDSHNHSIRGHCLVMQQGTQSGLPVTGSFEAISIPNATGKLVAVELEADLPAADALKTEFNLHMLVTADWKDGNASFRFQHHVIPDVPVLLEPTRQLKQAALGQLQEYLRCTYGRAFGAYLPAAFDLNFVE
ncbi:DUF1842 domain-containing protein [Undibacterium terreum]|uniref:DUF1842 domain-containing protein n=1 Tax=Undibacterium terreum TaxID=1224302 RepID=A0A916U5C9_9BURK|nr:DUF1842 domain-containing protein [Undibacterium terreum]GGC61239.1 hypothetical protein GCM10011396_05280 [Undibacterium terreum]